MDSYEIHKRFQQQQFNTAGWAMSKNIEYSLEDLLDVVCDIPDGREKDIAVSKLEEFVMWANKAIASSDKLCNEM